MYRVAQTVSHINSYLKPVDEARFFSNISANETSEYYQLFIKYSLLYLICDVITLFDATICVG